jgi:hypothetical protein
VEAEVAKSGEGFLEGLAGGDAAPLEGGEEFGALGGGLTEGKVGVGMSAIEVDEGGELSLGADEAAEDPLAVDDVVDVAAFLGEGGVEAGVVLGDVERVVGGVLGGEDGRLFGGLGGGSFESCLAGSPIAGVVLELGGHGFFLGGGWGKRVVAEFAEGGEGFAAGLAGGVHAPLKGREDLGVVGGGLSDGVVGIGRGASLVDVGVEFGFGAAEAEEEPVGLDDVVDVDALFGAGGL